MNYRSTAHSSENPLGWEQNRPIGTAFSFGYMHEPNICIDIPDANSKTLRGPQPTLVNQARDDSRCAFEVADQAPNRPRPRPRPPNALAAGREGEKIEDEKIEDEDEDEGKPL